MQEIIREIGDFRVYNLAETFGVLADTIEVIGATIMMIGGIWITHRIQKWADKSGGEHPAAANTGRGGGSERYEQNTIRD
ncbi:MAG: hypothetical protein IT334_12130 [Thermomicrobiales bacterium]|nr:hypothetical protein [Thermomicrobiales bacterium]